MSSPSQEEQARRLVYELQLMQSSAELLQQRLAVLQNAIADLTVAKQSIASLKEVEEGDPILIPAGGGTFVNANLGDLSKILVNIGADVSIEMGLDEAGEDISGRLGEVEKANQSVQQQLEQILGQMQIHRDTLNRLSAGRQGEQPGV
ncbi:MAG: prefoldin subunit alpha [Candidatus Bathyarchaeota archaeon]|nr:MAG: prefoldin subunit alpha [Candidatus Bathyarchaeota archaeon]